MVKSKREAQNPLILRCHRLMEAFAKSDEERDFYLDREEGFIVYMDLDKEGKDLSALEGELSSNPERYCLIPKLTFYEAKKIMEAFVTEKVYDIDTKEKLLDIIQSKEAREHFLEFLYDHPSELEKWQQYYQERWRIRIIEWLRRNNFHFVFEEDLDFSRKVIEKLKEGLFEVKVGKEVAAARKLLFGKAKTYYSNEALNPRPKRGRPPKQSTKVEVEPQLTVDIYNAVPPAVHPFLFTPDLVGASSVTFSSKFESGSEFLSSRKPSSAPGSEATLQSLNQKLAVLKNMMSDKAALESPEIKEKVEDDWSEEEEQNGEDKELEWNDSEEAKEKPKKSKTSSSKASKGPSKAKKPSTSKTHAPTASAKKKPERLARLTRVDTKNHS